MTEISEQGSFLARATGSNPLLIDGDRFEVVVTGHDGNSTHTLQPETVRHNPGVNSAKDLDVDVPPKQYLEDHQFLGGNLELYLNGTLLFEGEIRNINTNQNHDPYSLKARSPGKKLSGDTIDEKLNNEIVLDFIASTVDEYSEFDAHHNQLVGGDSETLNNTEEGGGNTRRVVDAHTSGTVTYSEVGSSAEDLEMVRVKCYTPGPYDIDVKISTSNNTYTETISSADQNRYGEWVEVDPTGLGNDSGSYDIEFTIHEDAILTYWIAMNEVVLDRVVHTPTVTDIDSGEDLYEKRPLVQDGSEQTKVIDSEGETTEGASATGFGAEFSESIGGVGGWRTRQKAVINIPGRGDINVQEDPGTGAADNVEIKIFSNAAGHAPLPYSLVNFDVESEFQDWELWARLRYDPDDGHNPYNFWVYEIDMQGTTQRVPLIINQEQYHWQRITRNDYNSNWDSTIEDSFDLGTTGLRTIEGAEDLLNNSPRYDPEKHKTIEPYINALVLVHGDQSSYDFNYQFDNTLDANNHFSRPHIYATNGAYAETKPYADRENISESTTTVTMDSVSSATADWGPKQRVDETAPYPDSAPNANSITNQYSYPGVGHQVRIEIPARGSRDDASPTEGYLPTKAWYVDVNTTHNDLPVLGSQDISDNRLGAISTIADDHDSIFRWEGTLCRIFNTGELTTDPDLREENINSSVSIEDVYERVKVKGLHNANSGWIISENAPDYMDDQKLIEDMSLETDAACVSKAKSFLRKHGSIKYSGKISTLATFAPVGAMMDGSHFNHGQDMIIKGVSYQKHSASINLGLDKDVATELVAISTDTKKESTRVTSNNMKVPSGEDVFE